MSNERRYQDDEVRQILDLAIDDEDRPPQALPASGGLTLRELQDVAREVGVPAERISRAVATFEGRGEAVPRGTTLGFPTTVGRIVPLPRNLTEREWELLVAELRTTFGGKGVVTSQGGLREWQHGDTHALIEPTETGYRLRLVDSSPAIAGIAVGGILMAVFLMIFVVLLGKGDPGLKLLFPSFFVLSGAAMAAASALSLPRWARRQEKSMEHLARRAASLLALPAPRDEPGPG